MKLRDRIKAFASDLGFYDVRDLEDFLSDHNLSLVSSTDTLSEYKERCLRAEGRLDDILTALEAHKEEKENYT